jgi:hypothetical protein
VSIGARAAVAVVASVLLCTAGLARAQSSQVIVLAVDADDDDADRVADRAQRIAPAGVELRSLSSLGIAPGSRLVLRGDSVRLLEDGRAADPAAARARAKRIELQAVKPGRGELEAGGRKITLGAVELRAVDGAGKPVELASGQATLQRTPPDRLGDDPFAPSSDPDALRFLVIGVGDDLPGTVDITSIDAAGAAVDVLSDVSLGEVRCPAGTPSTLVCGSTPPIRAVADDIDRNHPMVRARSVKAELGGALLVNGQSTELGSIRVGGPRQTPVGAMVRYRARLRVFMVRATPGGPPPMGGDAAGAVQLAQAEVRRANALWGACGISFGPPAELEARVVDPPRPHLLALGCDQGLPATGGAVRVRVDGVEIGARLTAGMRPAAAARSVAAAMTAAGFTARVSDNAAIAAGAHGASDVLVRRRDGSLASLESPASGAVSTDPTMTACIGSVELDDGLQHFGDVDAISGTVEERALIKAFDDNDPTTIEVVLVPSFAGGGRIGESFISADGGAIRNTVIEDRAGVRADRASSALSHELGHVLLDEPGHPDDFGLDTPTRLMDADAANPSAYGPRRLLVDECVRALRQSGPDAMVPLLTAWPLAPIGASGAAPAAPRAASRVKPR